GPGDPGRPRRGAGRPRRGRAARRAGRPPPPPAGGRAVTAAPALGERTLETGRTPGGQVLTAVRVPGARTAELRVVIPVARRSDPDAAHADVLGHALLTNPAVQHRFGLLGTDATAGADPQRLTVAASATLDGWVTTLSALAELL